MFAPFSIFIISTGKTLWFLKKFGTKEKIHIKADRKESTSYEKKIHFFQFTSTMFKTIDKFK